MILQVEDIPSEGRPQMTAGKFSAIIGQVDKKVRLNHDASLTIERGRPGEPIGVFDVADIAIEGNRFCSHSALGQLFANPDIALHKSRPHPAVRQRVRGLPAARVFSTGRLTDIADQTACPQSTSIWSLVWRSEGTAEPEDRVLSGISRLNPVSAPQGAKR